MCKAEHRRLFSWSILIFAASQAQVIEMLARLHSVVPARRPALKARVQHFQRLGLPSGVNTGKGRAARYGPGQIVELVLAFELSQMGLWPEFITSAVAGLGPELQVALTRLNLAEDREHWFDIAVAIDPSALRDLAREYGEPATTSPLEMIALEHLPQLVDALGSERRRISVLNLSASLGLAQKILRETTDPHLDLGSEIQEWAQAADPLVNFRPSS